MLKQSLCCGAFFLLLLAATSPAQNWTPLVPASGNTPAPRRNAAAIYDSLLQRLIVFGGKTDAGDRNDVWAFDFNGSVWTELTPASGEAPAPRFTANAIYDADRRHMIIWSGQGASFFNDVWAFDLQTNTWSQYNPPAPMPNIRYGTAAVFDPRARHLVTFAGFTDQGRFDDTWRFEIEQSKWQEVSPASVHPGKRCLHTASYDRRRHRMIIYGGQNNGPLGDVWALDLSQNTWADLTPAHMPLGRWFPASIYDARHHRILIFGGNLGAAQTNEVWAFDLNANAWQQLFAAGVAPSAREGAAAVYVEREDRMIVFGGRGEAHSHEVWALENLSATVSVYEPSAAAPPSFRLLGNYPNPFNPRTAIIFELPGAAPVTVKIYNNQGQVIRVLFDQIAAAGRHRLVWEGANQTGEAAGTGVYFCTVQSGHSSQTGKMLLAR